MPDLKSQLETLLAELKRRADAKGARVPSDTSSTHAESRGKSGLPLSDSRDPHDQGIQPEARENATGPEMSRRLDSTRGGDGRATNGANGDRKPARIDIVIGLDFGTRFTKVAYRIVGIDQTQIVMPDAAKAESAFFKSVVFIDKAAMTVHRRRLNRQTSGIEELPYLKLLLKNPEQPVVLLPSSFRSFIDTETIKILSAYFLAGVLRESIATILHREASRVAGKTTFYALNVSVPADHYDDDARGRFQEVAGVALQWAQGALGANGQATLKELATAYAADRLQSTAQADIAVFPEIIAALYQFITRPDTPSGIHGFLDIGGGTIDGCVFRLLRERNRTVEVNILAAKVVPLGTIIVAKKALAVLYADLERTVETEIVTRNDIRIEVPLPLERAAVELANFTAQLLITARDKMPGQLLVHDGVAAFDSRSRLVELAKSFTIFFGGGGAKSGWYRGIIEGIHQDRKLSSYGIMSYRCQLVPSPPDFDTFARIPFERFIIAHGLTTDATNLENLISRLPSQFGPSPALPAARLPTTSYADTKDAFT